MRSLISALAVVCIAATQVAAGSELPLKKGDRVRIKAVGQEGVFVVEDLQSEVLWMRDPDGIMSQKVRIADLSSLEVEVPNSPGRGAGHGAILGAVGGLAAGVLVGLASGDDPPNGFIALTAGAKASLLGVVGVAGGLLIGAIAGTIHPGERWESVPLSARLDAGMSGDGTARVGITFSIAGGGGG